MEQECERIKDVRAERLAIRKFPARRHKRFELRKLGTECLGNRFLVRNVAAAPCLNHLFARDRNDADPTPPGVSRHGSQERLDPRAALRARSFRIFEDEEVGGATVEQTIQGYESALLVERRSVVAPVHKLAPLEEYV